MKTMTPSQRTTFSVGRAAALAAFTLLAADKIFAASLSPALAQKMQNAQNGRLSVIVLFKGDALRPAPAPQGAFASPAAALQAQNVRPALAALAAQGATQTQDLWLVNGAALSATPSAIKTLAADPTVDAVIENFAVRTPEILTESAAEAPQTSANWGISKIGAAQVWEFFGVTGKNVRIGHLDTGVDASHPDLKGKIAAWAEFDAVGNRVRASAPHDTGVHGTHTAGTLVGGAASGTSIGVAPGAKLLSALVLNGQSGSLAQVIAGMQWVLDPDGNPATNDGAQILSMSLGAAGQYDIFRLVVDRLLSVGILPVFAIGNSGAGIADAPGNVPGVTSVGATSSLDAAAYFSGGAEKVLWDDRTYMKPEISAPGYVILSAVPGGLYQSFSGTSMATPHVAGAAALLLEARPDMSVDQIQKRLYQTAVDLGTPGQDARFGHGRLDVLAALSSVLGVSIVRGTTRGEDGPMPAVVRIRDAAGMVIKIVRADPKTGQFSLSLPEGEYTLEAVFGAARVEKQTLHIGKGGVVTLSLQIPATMGDLNNVMVYPNPFRPDEGHTLVTFDGLPKDARVQIYTLTGELVRDLTGATAGQYNWDVKNAQNEPVASGLYFYVASTYASQGGWQHKQGKVAVIR